MKTESHLRATAAAPSVSTLLLAAVTAAALYCMPGIARGQIFVCNNASNSPGQGRIGQYVIPGGSGSGNASLVTGLNGPAGIAVSGSNMFVVSFTTGTIGLYTTSGATVNASLITGLNSPRAIALSGDNLFVTNNNGFGGSMISKYTTGGALVNASLISGLDDPRGIAVSGENLFVTNNGNGRIGKYTTSGTTVNASLITGLDSPYAIAASGASLFVTDTDNNTVAEYSTSGATIDASLITGLSGDHFQDIAVYDETLYVTDYVNSRLKVYTTSGATVNPSLISGLNKPWGIAVVPEPSTSAVLAAGVISLFTIRRRRGNKHTTHLNGQLGS